MGFNGPAYGAAKGLTQSIATGYKTAYSNGDGTYTVEFTDGTKVVTNPIKGDKGDKGDKGEPGKDGIDGTTFTPSIGEVTTVDSNELASASVSVNTETKEAVFNFAIPRGNKGIDGVQISNNETVEDKTWSSSKIASEIPTTVAELSDSADYAKKTDLHSHTNKTVLDGVTEEKVTAWDKAQENIIESVKVNNQEITSDENKAVNIDLSGYAEHDEIIGENLIPYPYADGMSKTMNGIEYTVNPDGSVTAIGTATETSAFVLARYLSIDPNVTYILSGDLDDEITYESSSILFNAETNGGTSYWNYGKDKPVIFTGISVMANFRIRVTQGETVNQTFYPMLEIGSVAHKYQPYNLSRVSIRDDVDKKVNITDVCNPNLLDNAWFTVNQRGVTKIEDSTAWTYGADRWKFLTGAGTEFGDAWVSPAGIILQVIDENVYNAMVNAKNYTFSILDGDGNIEVMTGSGSAFKCTSGGYTVEFPAEGYGQGKCVAFSDEYAVHRTIEAIKLELGSVSTLANEVKPDYEMELAKCRVSKADTSDTYANKRVCTTNVVDAELTSIELSSNENYSSRGAGSFYTVKNGICTMRLYIGCDNPNNSFISIATGLPKPMHTEYHISINCYDTEGGYIKGLIDTSGILSVKYGTSNMSYIETITYQVAE